MRRIFPVLLVLCLLLCACGTQTPGQTTAATTQTTTQATTEATTVPATVETEPPVVYRNPLNGEILDAPYTGRPTAVVINNIKACLPHHGVSEADIMYEIETEGGITRCLAVFSDLTDVGTIGPVRSARSFFNNVAVSYDAPIIHCGGSEKGRTGGYDDGSGKITNWAHLDEAYNGKYFFRDEDRYDNKGYNWEHTLFTNGEKLTAGLTDKGFTPSGEVEDYGLLFEDEVTLSGEKAEKIVITFLGTKTTTMTYDKASGLYTMGQYNMDYIDANTGKDMTFKNVMVLYTDQWKIFDGAYYRSYYELEGTGDGYLAIDGKLVPIKWSRADLYSPFTYTLADGTPLTLATGHTYVAIAGSKSTPIAYE